MKGLGLRVWVLVFGISGVGGSACDSVGLPTSLSHSYSLEFGISGLGFRV